MTRSAWWFFYVRERREHAAIRQRIRQLFLVVLILGLGTLRSQAHFFGDRAWQDTNRNGIQDGGEPGFAGVRVETYLCMDSVLLELDDGTRRTFVRNEFIQAKTTAADGSVLFDLHVPDGAPVAVYLKYILPSGWAFTVPNSGSDDTLDSDADQVTGFTSCVTACGAGLSSCYQTFHDAGFVPAGSSEAPVLTPTGTPLDYVAGSGATAIDPGLQVVDTDSANLAGATVSISGNFQSSQDVLGFVNQNGITGSYNAATGVLTLSGTTTVVNYRTALRSVTYRNTNATTPNTAPRTITFTASDGVRTGSATRQVNILVPNPPTITPSAGSMIYIKGGPPTLLDPGLVLADPDSALITGGAVKFLQGNDLNDILVVPTQNGISGTFVYATGTLTLSGTATVAQYQAAFRSITFWNPSAEPGNHIRVVQFSATDGVGTGTASRVITIATVNKAPTLDPIADPAPVPEDSGVQVVALSGITAGPGDAQTLTVTATSSDPALIPQPLITYSSPSTSGTLSYTPVPQAHGSATITVTVKDDGGTTAGGIDTTQRSFNVVVNPVNDAPSISVTPGLLDYTLSEPARVVDAGLGLADIDSPNLSSASIEIVDGFETGADVLALDVPAGMSGSYDAALGIYALTGIAPIATYQAALRTLRYSHPQPEGSLELRTVRFTVQDGSGTASAERQVHVLPINVAPTLDALGSPPAILEDAGAQTIVLSGISAGGGHTQQLAVTATSSDPSLIPTPPVTYTSPDTTGSIAYTPAPNAFGSAMITVTVADDGGTAAGGADTFSRTFPVTVAPVNDPPQFTMGPGPVVLEDASPQVISGWASGLNPGPFETDQSIQFDVSADQPALFSQQPSLDPLGVLRFTPAPNAAGTATVNVRARDNGGTAAGGVDASAWTTFQIAITPVNDAPIVVPSGAVAEFAEGGVAVTVDPGLTLADVDSPQLAGASVRLVQGFQSVSDLMVIVTPPGINASYDAATGTLALAGNASLAAYQTALRAVTFRNSGNHPGTERTLSVTVNDGTASSATVLNLRILPINDGPSLTLTGGTVVYNAGAPGAVIDAGLVAADPDDANLAGANVGIVAGFQAGGDTLLFTAQNGITGTYDPTVGVLTLAGVASVANYQLALRSVRFENLSPVSSPGPRGIAFQVTDGLLSASAQRTLEVNVGPGITLSPGTTRYTRGGPPRPIDPGLIVSDPNSPQLPEARARLIQGIEINDTLAFTPRAGITGTFDLGTWSITFRGLASIADYQAVLRSVTFWNPGQDPGNHLRLIEFSVSDGTATAVAVRTIRIAGPNAAPTLDPLATPLTLLEDAGPQSVPLTGLSGGGGETQELTVTAVSSNPGAIPNPSVLYTSPSATGSLNFTPVTGASGSALITVTVRDDGGTALGGVDTTARAFTVSVLPVNDAPTLDPLAGPLQVLEDMGQQAVPLTGIGAGAGETQALTISAVASDPLLLAGVVVNHTPGAANGTLRFSPGPDLNGTASITITVLDDGGTANGGVNSVSRTVTVQVPAVNDAPNFLKGADLTLSQNAGPQTRPNWASAIRAGPPNEHDQSLEFLLTGGNGYFTQLPSVSADGTLRFTPAPFARGTVSLTIQLRDNGGTGSGGVDLSAPQAFTIFLGSPTDADGDGMADDWETAYGLDPDDGGDGAVDGDGDGFSNREEFEANTHPLDPSQNPAIVEVTSIGADVSIRFRTALGKSYRIERSGSPRDGAWMPLSADLPGTGGVVEALNPGAAGMPAEFYRVVVVPTP
jgi:hypothetical protein